MTLPQIIFAAVVFLVGIPAAVQVRQRGFPVGLRNLTAAALVAAYFAVQALWYAGGVALPTEQLVCIDLAVIAAIYLKPPAHDCWPYRSRSHQLCAFWLELSAWDRAVMALFPAAWLVYVVPMTEAQEWWRLYWLSLAQILAAGAESFTKWLSARAANASETVAPDNPSSGAEFAWAGESRGYG